MAGGTVIVTGLSNLQRDLAQSGPAVSAALREGLRRSAEPVKRDAEALARSRIRRMSRTPRQPPPWSVQRIGVTRHAVFIAPKERGVKSRTDRRKRRPNLAELMLGRSYNPALEENRGRVLATVNSLLTTVTKEI